MLLKQDIKRGNINYNFLKNIIIRFDFQGMDESELEAVLSEISPYLKEDKVGYISKNKQISKEWDIDIDDPENIENEGLSLRNVREQNIYVFQNRDPQVSLKISSTFAVISIKKTKYVDCIQYCDTLNHIMRIVQEKVPYFNCTRFGLRKINQCYLLDINKLNEYFEEKHFKLFSFGDNSSTKVRQVKDNMFIKEYNLNFTRSIIQGEIEGKEAHQINIDADIYLLGDENNKKIISGEKQISEMNNILFELYKDSVTEKFLQQLIDGQFDENIIKGVIKND